MELLPGGCAIAELTDIELAAWRGMLRVQHRVRHVLGDELTRRYGLSMADYDAMVAIVDSPDREIRMATLAEVILQPRSSVTRLVDSLEQRELVTRRSSPDDGRGTSAALTAAGLALFRRAHRTHLAGVRRLFLDHLDERQQRQLGNAWAAIDPDALY